MKSSDFLLLTLYSPLQKIKLIPARTQSKPQPPALIAVYFHQNFPNLKSSLLAFLLLFSLQFLSAEVVNLKFYSVDVALQYSPAMLSNYDVRFGYADRNGKLQVQSYYERQRGAGAYLTLLNELRRVKREYELNDWLFYQLTRDAVEKIAAHQPKKQRVLLRWTLLNLAGYDCRLTYQGNKVYLNLFTTEELFEMPMIEENGRLYANLSENEYPGAKVNSLYIADYAANPGGRPFSFSPEKLPKFPSQIVKKTIDFVYHETPYSLEMEYDKMPIEVMQGYPYLSDSEYFSVPLSEAARASLLPQLREIIKDKNQWEALSVLASFTRSAFAYKIDERQFGKSRPMIPEEVFYYPYSDCEDRCALFYVLTKELLGLPQLVLTFDDHVSMAVAPPYGVEGDALLYQDRRYYIVDPTGPSNSSRIGFFPRGYKERAFEIMRE